MWQLTVQSNLNQDKLVVTAKTVKGLAESYEEKTGRCLSAYVIRNIYYGRKNDPCMQVVKIPKGHEQQPPHPEGQTDEGTQQSTPPEPAN